tara:strand:- start:283 stop:483 length:201 start_codon:yes stop_codon:yes gene_type:complete
MTKDSAINWFCEWILPAIEKREEITCNKKRNTELRVVAWSEYTDALFKDGRITTDQFKEWSIPGFI